MWPVASHECSLSVQRFGVLRQSGHLHLTPRAERRPLCPQQPRVSHARAAWHRLRREHTRHAPRRARRVPPAPAPHRTPAAPRCWRREQTTRGRPTATTHRRVPCAPRPAHTARCDIVRAERIPNPTLNDRPLRANETSSAATWPTEPYTTHRPPATLSAATGVMRRRGAQMPHHAQPARQAPRRAGWRSTDLSGSYRIAPRDPAAGGSR